MKTKVILFFILSALVVISCKKKDDDDNSNTTVTSSGKTYFTLEAYYDHYNEYLSFIFATTDMSTVPNVTIGDTVMSDFSCYGEATIYGYLDINILPEDIPESYSFSISANNKTTSDTIKIAGQPEILSINSHSFTDSIAWDNPDTIQESSSYTVKVSCSKYETIKLRIYNLDYHNYFYTTSNSVDLSGLIEDVYKIYCMGAWYPILSPGETPQVTGEYGDGWISSEGPTSNDVYVFIDKNKKVSIIRKEKSSPVNSPQLEQKHREPGALLRKMLAH